MVLCSQPKCVGVCGLGQIGLPLALTCWRSGYSVIAYETNVERRASALPDLRKLDDWMKRELPELMPNYGALELASDLATLNRHADLIVECIWEDLDSKVSLLRSLVQAARRGAIFCSCTSGLSISEMGRRSGFPEQLAGTHFWSPPHLMPLVEVVSGSETAGEVLNAVTRFCETLGKRPVRVNIDAPGFIGNRMLHALWREAINIVERGIASAEDVDTVAKLTFGLRQSVLGPMEHMDLAGLDLIQNIHSYLLADLASNPNPSELLHDKVRQGYLGIKTGQGFHDWSKRDAVGLVEARDRQIVLELKRLSATGKKFMSPGATLKVHSRPEE